jgi:probable phosphoglycerate mutase
VPAVTEARPPVYFIRHGETDWNRQGLIQGWTDTPLNETGRAQARGLARTLAALPGFPAGFRFVVSPLLRARQTMDAIATAGGIMPNKVVIAEKVKELGFGVWEGRSFRELEASPMFPTDAGSRYFWRPDGGESYRDGHLRMADFRDRLDAPAVVVAHGAIGRCLIGALCALAPAELVSLRIPQGSICRIEGGRTLWLETGNSHQTMKSFDP